MFGKYFRKAKDYVGSIDDLQDARAREVAHDHGLEIGEILPLCTQVNEEVREQHQHLLIEDISPGDREVMFRLYDRMIASVVVVSYELSGRERVQFPKPRRRQISCVRKDIVSALRLQEWRAIRVGPPIDYEKMGAIFAENLRLLPAKISIGRIEVDIYGANQSVHSRN